jgi:CheY-like chemotaxis protein
MAMDRGAVAVCNHGPWESPTFFTLKTARLPRASPRTARPKRIDAERGAMATILVVDDEPLVRATLKTMLERIGHTVVFCESGQEALAAFTDWRFDAVLSDVRMPQGDGVWLLREIRKRSADLPVFLMTGLIDDRRLKNVVFDDRTVLLEKPLDLRDIITMLAGIDGMRQR